jgi:prepilin-type N-terminal cleavage/methylation domain-containing protein
VINKLKKNKKGFTLIELVVVIAILGVLALLVVPTVVNKVDEAKKSVDKANLKMIQTAIEMYNISEDSYPDAENFGDLESKLVPAFLDEWPELQGDYEVTYDSETGKLSYSID